MANIKQQRKRVKIAARQRQENLKYKSRIKTMFRSLSVAAAEDKEKASQLGLELISVIDKAAGRGILHANSAAHKKSRVYAMVELTEGAGKAGGPAATGSKSGQSKRESRATRRQSRDEKAAAVKEKHKRLAEAEAKAAKAKPKQEPPAAAESEAAKPQPAAPAAEEESKGVAGAAESGGQEPAPEAESGAAGAEEE